MVRPCKHKQKRFNERNRQHDPQNTKIHSFKPKQQNPRDKTPIIHSIINKSNIIIYNLNPKILYPVIISINKSRVSYFIINWANI